MNTPKILSCGEVLWDLFPKGPRFGGAAGNFACHAAIIGGVVFVRGLLRGARAMLPRMARSRRPARHRDKGPEKPV